MTCVPSSADRPLFAMTGWSSRPATGRHGPRRPSAALGRMFSCLVLGSSMAMSACGDDGRAGTDGGAVADGGTSGDASFDGGAEDAGVVDGGEGLPDAGEIPACTTPADGMAELWVAVRTDAMGGSGTEADPFARLEDAIGAAGDGATIHIGEGRFVAPAMPFTDPTRGNCDADNFREDNASTVGYRVRCKALTLLGASRERTVLVTGAGYGLLFEEAGSSRVEQLRVTGGVRGPAQGATEGAIVARNTNLSVIDVDVVENDDLYSGEPDPVVGLIGIVGREGANLTVEGCRILDNSWDGIALYQGDPDVSGSEPRAIVRDTEVGCTGTASTCINRRGRGVGIGTTCGAHMEIERAVVYGFWKGISAFAGSDVQVVNSVVRGQATWGITVGSRARIEVINSVVADNGEAGLSISSSTGFARYVNNLVVGNGRASREQILKRAGFWSIVNDPSLWELEHNAFFGNMTETACFGGEGGGADCTPLTLSDTNVLADPMVDADYVPGADSPLIDAGDDTIRDGDGSVSDIGLYGGPMAPPMPTPP